MEGKIVVGSRMALASKIMDDAIFEFNKIYPNVKIELLIRKRNELDEMLHDNIVDVVFDDFKYCENNKDIEIVEFNRKVSSLLVGYSKYKKEIENAKEEDLIIYNVYQNSFCNEFENNNKELKFENCRNTTAQLKILKKDHH